MIKLDDNFYLTNDNSQWTLHYEKEGEISDKTGKPTLTKDTWYCNKLEQALNRYANEAIKPAKGAVELMKMIKECRESIEETCKTIK